MVTREEILVEVRKVPEKYLDELYQIIKEFEARPEAEQTDQRRDGRAPTDQDFSLTGFFYHGQPLRARRLPCPIESF